MSHLAKIQGIYEEACRLSDEKRLSYLNRTCGGDDALRQEVMSLLAVDTGEKAIFERPIVPDATLVGRQLGRYLILKELGRGGMGRVYLGEEREPVQRHVAIKFVPYWGLGDEGRQRFMLEQSVLARMNHSYIAMLHEAAMTEDGQPYFVMEYLAGEPITAYCDRRGLNIESRLQLFAKVCQGVVHAHLKGVIHRDLKPSNILIVEEEGRPIPKIIDFGIAKAFDGPQLTNTGYRPGTFRYMSPEQARETGRDGAEIDTRSDVYSLGVLLYELLVGEPPLEWSPNATHEQIRKDILAKMPRKPSSYWRELSDTERHSRAALRGASVQKITRILKGDLDRLVMAALEKQPDRRYQSPADLIKELQRWRDHRPIEASPPSLPYLFSKFLVRHWGVASLAGVALVLILGFSAFVQQKNALIARERDTARQEALTSAEILDYLIGIFESEDPHLEPGLGSRENTLFEVMEECREGLDRAFPNKPEVRAHLMRTFGRIYRNRGHRAEAAELYTKAMAVQRQLNGERDPLVIADTHDLGLCHLLLGDLNRAESFLEVALDGQFKLTGMEDPVVARYLNTLAELQLERGETAQAKYLVVQARNMALHHYGAYHREIIRSYNILGRIHNEWSEFEDAVSCYAKALETSDELYGTNHPQRTDILHDLARSHMEHGDFRAAEGYLLQALELDRRNFGNNHPYVIDDRHSLARLYFAKGEMNKAEPLYRWVIDQMWQQGTNYPSLATALEYQSDVLAALGDRSEEALSMIRESMDLRRYAYGHGHRAHVRSLLYLGDMLLAYGEFQEAYDIVDSALKRGGPHLDEPSIEHYLILGQKGHSLAGLGRYVEAGRVLRFAHAQVLSHEDGTCYFQSRIETALLELAKKSPIQQPLSAHSE